MPASIPVGFNVAPRDAFSAREIRSGRSKRTNQISDKIPFRSPSAERQRTTGWRPALVSHRKLRDSECRKFFQRMARTVRIRVGGRASRTRRSFPRVARAPLFAECVYARELARGLALIDSSWRRRRRRRMLVILFFLAERAGRWKMKLTPLTTHTRARARARALLARHRPCPLSPNFSLRNCRRAPPTI